MGLKDRTQFRVGTLNIGLHVSNTEWELRAKTIASLMEVYAIDVLCLQELHIFEDSAIEQYITKCFADLHYRITLETMPATNSPSNKKKEITFTGVAIISSKAYSAQAKHFKRREKASAYGRHLTQSIPLNTEEQDLGSNIKRCAIQTVYGHSGFATKAIYDDESRAKLLQ